MGRLNKFAIGDKRWVRQYIFGFPIIAEIEQARVFRRDASAAHAPDIAGMWAGNAVRCALSPRDPGALNAQTLWPEACEKETKGWLGIPLPIDRAGIVKTYENKPVLAAFRFGVEQMAKLRACDDLKYSTTGLCCTLCTPVKLTTLGQIAQIYLDLRDTRTPRSFYRTDHGADYKQLPLDARHS